SALSSEDPVVFFESQRLYDNVEVFNQGGVPADYYRIPIGEPDIKRAGDDVTILTVGPSLYAGIAASQQLQTSFGVSADLPGHGASGMDVAGGSISLLADRVAAALDARALQNLHVIGHSLGGGVALWLAASRPDLVRSLTLIAPAGLGAGLDHSFLEIYSQLADPEETEVVLQRLVVRPRLISKQLAGMVLRQLRAPGSRTALEQVAASLIAEEKAIWERALKVAATSLPRLTIWGENDQINPLSRDKLSAFSGGHLILENVGHLPQIENPKAVNEAIVRFIAAG
ncbi:MAG: alpha/beta fold hydrolase, partial [Microlunatus sp.]